MSTETLKSDRIIGHLTGDKPGPNLICMAGMHGNEPAGILALESITERLSSGNYPMKGSFIAIRGNMNALRLTNRFVDEDLNRIWKLDEMEILTGNRKGELPWSCEREEQSELFELLAPMFAIPKSATFLMDLHTTSAASAPFVIMSDTLRNRRFGMEIPAPVILGLEEFLDGTLINYVDELSLQAIAFEAGQHDDPHSIYRHRAAIWIALCSAGCLDRQRTPEYKPALALLRNASAKHAKVFDIQYRYGIGEEEKFSMLPGFENFQAINEGTLVAKSDDQPVKTSLGGFIFMPLYQDQGSDGFFIVRRVRRVWLEVSRWLRYLHLDRLLPLLPGIRRVENFETYLEADRRICRWYVTEFFHLLGYRRKQFGDDSITFIKRRLDP